MAGFSSSDSDSDGEPSTAPQSRGASGRGGNSSTGGSSVTVHGSAPTEGAALQAALANMADEDSDSSGEDWDASAVAQAGAAAAQQARARGVKGPINLTMGNVQLPHSGSPSHAASTPPAVHTPVSDWDRESTVGSTGSTPRGAPLDKGAGLEQFLSDSDEDGAPSASPGVPPAVQAALQARGAGVGHAPPPGGASKPWMRSLEHMVPPAPGPPVRQLPQASPLKSAASPEAAPPAGAGKSISPQVAAAATAELRQYTERLLKGGGAFATVQHDVMQDPAWRRLLELAAAGAGAAAGGARSRAFAVRATGAGGEGISIVTGRAGGHTGQQGAEGAYIIEGGRGGSNTATQAGGTVRRLGQEGAHHAFQHARPTRSTPSKAAAPLVQGGAFSRLYHRQAAGAQGRAGGAALSARSAFAAARASKAELEHRRRAAAGAGGRRGQEAAARRAAVHEVLGEAPLDASRGGGQRRSAASQRAGYGTWGSSSSSNHRTAPAFGSSIPRLAGETPSPEKPQGRSGGTPPQGREDPPQRPQSSRAAERQDVQTMPQVLPPARRGSFSADAPSSAGKAWSSAPPPTPPPGVSVPAHKAPSVSGQQWGLPFHSTPEQLSLLGARLAADAAKVQALQDRVAQLEAAVATAGLQV